MKVLRPLQARRRHTGRVGRPALARAALGVLSACALAASLAATAGPATAGSRSGAPAPTGLDTASAAKARTARAPQKNPHYVDDAARAKAPLDPSVATSSRTTGSGSSPAGTESSSSVAAFDDDSVSPQYATPSGSENGTNCIGTTADGRYAFSGRYAPVTDALLFQRVNVAGGSWSLSQPGEHQAIKLTFANTVYQGVSLSVGLWKGDAPGWTDTLPTNQSMLFVEMQRQGAAVAPSDPTYRWIPLFAVPDWETHTVEIEVNQADRRYMRVKVDGIDRTGWYFFDQPADWMIASHENYYSNTSDTVCDNHYTAVGNMYWGMPYDLDPLAGPGLAFGFINDWDHRHTLNTMAYPYCGSTDPNGVYWVCGTAADSDGDGIYDYRDNCPSYYSTDNKCDSEVVYAEGWDYSAEVSASGGTTSTSSANCRSRWFQREGKNALYITVIRYRVRIQWCWNASVITEVAVTRVPEISWPCCWKFNGHIAYDVTGTNLERTYYSYWGRTAFEVFAQGKFDNCLVKDWGCIQQRLPWVLPTVYRGGSTSFQNGG